MRAAAFGMIAAAFGRGGAATHPPPYQGAFFLWRFSRFDDSCAGPPAGTWLDGDFTAFRMPDFAVLCIFSSIASGRGIPPAFPRNDGTVPPGRMGRGGAFLLGRRVALMLFLDLRP